MTQRPRRIPPKGDQKNTRSTGGSSVAVAALRMETLCTWAIERAEGFPRKVKFSLGDRWIDANLAVVEHLVEASYTREKRPALLAASRTRARARRGPRRVTAPPPDSSRPRPRRRARPRRVTEPAPRVVTDPPRVSSRLVSSRLVSSFPRRREPSRFARKRKQTWDSPPIAMRPPDLVTAPPTKAGVEQDNAKSMHPAVYLVASGQNRTLYTGVTSNLVNRICEHRSHRFEGFTANHDCTILVWFEMHATMTAAFVREKSIKKWRRAWKIRLIEDSNPGWEDLWPTIIGSDVRFPPSRE